SAVKRQLRCFVHNKKSNNWFVSDRGSCYCLVYEDVAIKSIEYPGTLVDAIPFYTRHHALRSGDTVVDAGAHVGIFSLYAARRVGPEGLVIAFEPDPVLFEQLVQQIALNDIKNIRPVKKGLWSEDGVSRFFHDEANSQTNSLFAKSGGEKM